MHTLVIGAGQAGLATSYRLAEAGIEHLVVEQRNRLGGDWPQRWDSFTLVTPNFAIRLPGMSYSGPDPEGFLSRDEIVSYLREYAASIAAPVRLGTRVRRLATAEGCFEVHTGGTTFVARNVILATGPYQRPRIPAASRQLPPGLRQLHSQRYRRPDQLADGAVLVVGSGQSGTQIAEELHQAGREVHIAVSRCPSAPRRYRGQDVIWWLLESLRRGAAVGVPPPTVDDLPSPADRFACIPHLSGTEGGHDIDLRQLARRGVVLYGKLESAAGTTVRFRDDLADRLVLADSQFDQQFRPRFDAYIEAAGIDAPPDDRPPHDDFIPDTSTWLDLDTAGIGTVIWATGYELDFSWVELPVLDQWGYPRHVRGVTTQPGLYAIGLPWLYSDSSAALAGVGDDAAHITAHITGHSTGR
ncbi:MAG: flavin-containing monooxygenase [Pseudonocardiaceae bacterium]